MPFGLHWNIGPFEGGGCNVELIAKICALREADLRCGFVLLSLGERTVSLAVAISVRPPSLNWSNSEAGVFIWAQAEGMSLFRSSGLSSSPMHSSTDRPPHTNSRQLLNNVICGQ